MKILYRWVVLGLLLMVPAAAMSGEVTIQTQMAASTTDASLVIVAKVASLGNAPANEVNAVLSVLGQEYPGRIIPPEALAPPHKEGSPEALIIMGDVRFRPNAQRLGSREAALWRYTVELPSGLAGSFPASLLITYKDENSHPLSCVALIVFKTPGAGLSGLEASADDITLQGQGELAVKITNPLENSVMVKASLVLPQAFSGKIETTQVPMLAGGSEELRFPLVHKDSVGGTHAVFCILEYDQEGRHHTAMIPARINARPPAHWFTRSRLLWIVVDGVLIALFVGLWVRPILARRKSKHHNISK